MRETADELAESELDDLDVTYRTIGLVGTVPDDIIATAEELACDHVFVVGGHRSPIGKAVFGDEAQSLILNFDGPITVRIASK